METKQEEKKRDWVEIISKGCIILVAAVIITLAITAKDITAPLMKEQNKGEPVFITCKTYYDDNNNLQRVVYDPETGVMYVILEGKLMSPLYNGDGTLRTFQPQP